ncbi:MAG: hypothetical protein IJH12_01885 [Clostridia bacterium]|nr:hypothetical protein [Clostridia bacterium]
MTKSVNPFIDNTDGILTHSGEIKVAKSNVEQKILDISDEGSVLVKGRTKSYHALVHVELLPLIQYAEKGDTGFIKFRNGEAFIVGFRKNLKRADKYERFN